MKEKIKQLTNTKQFHICMVFTIIVIILFIAGVISLKYNVEGENTPPFNISKISIISGTDGTDIEGAQEKWNLEVSQNNDIYVYIGSCIKTESYVYDSYPSWATNKEVWKDCIKKEQSIYKIDLVKAIKKQLKSIGISHIKVSKIDTFKDKNYYSHLAEYNGIKEKSGQNFVGFYYK